jgi:FtsP/CotA-like multicopper oxidase with cupredoxin domain
MHGRTLRTFMSLFLLLATPLFMANMVGAQTTPPPPTGPVPGINYGIANYANSPLPSVNASGAVVPGTGMRKFVDRLPGLTAAGANALGQYIPVATPGVLAGFPNDDYYEIALVEYTEKMHSDLSPTKLRGYVQEVNGVAVGQPHYLGPVIVATTGRPVRIKFTNRLPVGTNGNLFIPVDTTIMGAGQGPLTSGGAPCNPATTACASYTQNRGTLHLHGGNTPWISDGTPHQWTAPVGDTTPFKKGASTQNVPDMAIPSAGSMTFYYTNQQSGRLMFYHDHAYGITRLNVYAGEAAGYLLQDRAGTGEWTLGLPADQIPLVIQDKTFVWGDRVAGTGTYATDPTWATLFPSSTAGNLWFPHVYMPNQDPNAIDGSNPVGRWDYGPWFWPVFPVMDLLPGLTSAVPEAFMDTPVVNGTAYPYLEVDAKAYRFRILNACNDRFINLQLHQATSIVGSITVTNPGSGYTSAPTVTITGGGGTGATAIPSINAAGGVAGITLLTVGSGYTSAPTVTITGGGGTGATATASVYQNSATAGVGMTEVGMVPYFPPQTNWPVDWGTADARDGGVPDPTLRGPAMIQIGTEGGLLPAPAVINNVPINYDYNRRSVTVLNVLEHALFLGPAERADVIVDFSQYAGKTLILYNDAPAPVPASDPRVDYYTGNFDLRDFGGAPSTLPGYGPNTRTVMQIRVRGTDSGVPGPVDYFNTGTKTSLDGSLPTAFAQVQPALHVPPNVYARISDTALNLNGPQPLAGITVTAGGTGYTSAPTIQILGGGGTGATATATVAAGSVTAITLTNPGTGYSFTPTVSILGGGGRNAAAVANVRGAMTMQSKAIQELFDNLGRMNSILGTELPATNAFVQTTIPLMYIDPPTEKFKDGEVQLWKITHNGVDTHAIHVHLFDAQLINRVGWDNAVKPPDPNEMGWKDTIRMNPLEDIVVAVKAQSQNLPWKLPDNVRLLDVTMPQNSTGQFSNVDPFTNNPVTTTNVMTNFGWEYVWHCHLLGHEENDMMRPMVMQVAPAAPTNLTATRSGLTVSLAWTNNAVNPAVTAFVVQRATNSTFTAGLQTFSVAAPTTTLSQTVATGTYYYRVRAENAKGYSPWSNTATVTLVALPAAPTNLRASTTGTNFVILSWTDNANNEQGFYIERSTNGGATWTRVGTTAANTTSFRNLGLTTRTTYLYRVQAYNAGGTSAFSNVLTVTTL